MCAHTFSHYTFFSGPHMHFNVTKYQKRAPLQSWKVGGAKKFSFLPLFRILSQKYGYFRNFQKSPDVTIRYIDRKSVV